MIEEWGNLIVVKAPCPGVVWRIAEKEGRHLSEGDNLKEGEEIMNIEFMKMFIPILAPIECRIVKLLVMEGKSVKEGEVLVVLEKLKRE